MLRISLLALLLPSMAFAQTGGRIYFSSKTVQTGRKEVVQSTGNVRQTQTVRSLGVLVEYRSVQPARAPYEVQCFFIARDEATRDRFVYYSETTTVKGGNGKLEFRAKALKGTTKTETSIPITGTTETGEPFISTISSTQEVPGSKMEGWVVRILSEGKVVQVDSNQPHLRTLAMENPGWLDDALRPRD